MRWFVSRDGQTQGPYEEEQLREMARRDAIRGAMVRDDAGGAWIKAEASPFGALMTERGWTAPIVCGLVVAVFGAGSFGMLGAVIGGLLTFGALALYRRL